MTTDARETINALADGQAHTEPETDWEMISELVGVDLEEYECDYEYYIMERVHQTTFIKGDVKIDGHTYSRELAEGRDGYTPPTEDNEAGVVILGNLEVSGNLDIDELTSLFVSGNVKAGTIMNCYGSLVAGGSIEADLVYCDSADEGGQIHTEDCQTKLFIDASSLLDYACGGDYPYLLANHYNPRQRYTLQRSLEEMGFEHIGMTFSSRLSAVIEEGAERIARLLELIEKNRDAIPENVPDNAEWSEEHPAGYRLTETDENGELHGIEGHWKADGTVRYLKHYKNGKLHGPWTIEQNGVLLTRHYEEGEPSRPEGVPDDAVWKEDQSQWELAPTDANGEKHGDAKWWRSNGTLACENHYEHGLAQGEGRRYHDSGEISQTYSFVDDKLHGERTWYPTQNETSETATQGYGDNVARIVTVYEHGNPVGPGQCYDADGNAVDPYGSPLG